jgi:hypothetical protein
MTLAAIITAAVALGVAAVAVWLAVLARAEGITCRRELARHRAAHAQAAEQGRPPEERRTSRHHGPAEPVQGTPTEQIPAQRPDAPATSLIESPEPPRGSRLPRPGRIQ